MTAVAWIEQIEPGPLLLVLAMLIAIATLMRRSYRKLGRRGAASVSDEATSRRPASAARSLAHAPREMQHWQVEMHDLERELSARLDSKMSALQALIIQADERIESLQHAAAGDASPPPAAENATLAGERRELIYALADEGLSAEAIAGRTGGPVGEIELILGLRSRT